MPNVQLHYFGEKLMKGSLPEPSRPKKQGGISLLVKDSRDNTFIVAGQRNMIPVLGEKLIDHCCMDHYKHLHEQQGEEAASASTSRDPCAPGGALCGPVRPAVDFGADIDLTKGWLGEKDPKPCCPCRGKGARLINYGDYPGGGFYNTYTMELCRSVCGNVVH